MYEMLPIQTGSEIISMTEEEIVWGRPPFRSFVFLDFGVMTLSYIPYCHDVVFHLERFALWVRGGRRDAGATKKPHPVAQNATRVGHPITLLTYSLSSP